MSDDKWGRGTRQDRRTARRRVSRGERQDRRAARDGGPVSLHRAEWSVGEGVGEKFAAENVAGLTGASDATRYAAANVGRLQQPGQSQQYWNKVQGQFNAPTNAQQAYDALQQGPGFDAYYDRARERMAGGMNDQLAARGMYGSSAGMDMMGQGLSDLNAQQANREADYMLQQQDLLTRAAQGADEQNQGLLGLGSDVASLAQQNQLADLLGGSKMLNDSGRLDMDRTKTGFDIANSAQDLRERRIQQKFDNIFKTNAHEDKLMLEEQQAQLESFMGIFDTIMQLDLGEDAEALNQIYREEKARMERTKMGLDLTGDVINSGTSAYSSYGGG